MVFHHSSEGGNQNIFRCILLSVISTVKTCTDKQDFTQATNNFSRASIENDYKQKNRAIINQFIS